jgi:hypothetical protein
MLLLLLRWRRGSTRSSGKIGKLDSQEESGGKARVMLRVLLLGAGALGAFLVGKKALGAFQEKAAERGGGNSPIDVLARGLTHVQARLGPWSMRDLTLGLLAISKVASLSLSLSLSLSDIRFVVRSKHALVGQLLLLLLLLLLLEFLFLKMQALV